MSAGNAKDLRKAVKNVLQDLLPELLTVELINAIRKDTAEIVTNKLNDMDARARDVQTYMMNQMQAALFKNNTVTPLEEAQSEETILNPLE